MPTERAIELGQEAVMTCLTLVAPILIVGIAIAIVLGILQSMTQIQDQTISFVPKIVLIAVTFLVCLPWCTERIVEYSREQLQRPKFMSPVSPQASGKSSMSNDRTANNSPFPTPATSVYR